MSVRFLHKASLIGALAAILAASPAAAQDQDQQAAETRLSEIDKEIKDRAAKEAALRKAAEDAAREAEMTKASLIDLAQQLQSHESNATALEERIDALEQEEVEKAANLDTRRQDLVELLATLERLGNRPAALALMQPTKALDTVRTANLLSTLVPQVEARAAELRLELDDLKEIRSDLVRDRKALDVTLNDMHSAEAAMKALRDRQISQSKKATQDADQHAKAIKKLADEAKSLNELIEKIIARNMSRNRPENIAKLKATLNMAAARGTLTLPARGKITERFGTKQTVGTSKGLRIETRGDAQVVSPYDGEVIFADEFRDYGLILIIAHGSEYHSLVAGLEEIYPSVGDWLLEGEPIGLMAPDRINGAGNSIKPRLYLEIRRKNVPINPSPWFKQ